MAVVLPERREVHQRGNLGRCKAFDQLLHELRVAEQLLVAGIVVLTRHACSCLDPESLLRYGRLRQRLSRINSIPLMYYHNLGGRHASAALTNCR